MAGAVNLLPILAVLAGPAVVAAIYARQSRKAARAMTRELLQVQQRLPKYIELRPLRWYDLIVITAVFALPFVQWFAYLEYRTRLSFLLPLAIAAGVMFIVGTLRPRFIAAEPPNHREAGLRAAVLVAALMTLLALPPSGMVTVLRGAISDILGLLIVSHLARVWNAPKTEAGISR